MTFKNNQVINQKFTDSEIETLKNIANEVIKSEKVDNLEKNKLDKNNELTKKIKFRTVEKLISKKNLII